MKKYRVKLKEARLGVTLKEYWIEVETSKKPTIGEEFRKPSDPAICVTVKEVVAKCSCEE